MTWLSRARGWGKCGGVNRRRSIAEGELSKLEQELHQAKFELLQLESTVARFNAAVRRHLESRRILTTRLLVVGPSYVDVRVTATVRALAPSRLLRVSSADLDALYRHDLRSYAIIILNLARELSRRLRETKSRICWPIQTSSGPKSNISRSASLK